MFYVHRNVGHCGGIDVIESPHQRSIKPFAVFKQLMYMAAYYIQSNMIGRLGQYILCLSVWKHLVILECPPNNEV